MCSRARVSSAEGGRKILSLPSRCVLSYFEWVCGCQWVSVWVRGVVVGIGRLR